MEVSNPLEHVLIYALFVVAAGAAGAVVGNKIIAPLLGIKTYPAKTDISLVCAVISAVIVILVILL